MPSKPVSAYPAIRLNSGLRELLLAEATKRLYTPSEEAAEKAAHERCLEAVYGIVNTKATWEEMQALQKFGCAAPITGIRLSRTQDGGVLDFCFCLRDVRRPPSRNRSICTNDEDSEAVKACALPMPGLKSYTGRAESRYDGLPKAAQEALRPFVTDYWRAANATDEARKAALLSVQAVLKQARTLQALFPVLPWTVELVELCATQMEIVPICTEADIAVARSAFPGPDA